jgi:hypothetical protein
MEISKRYTHDEWVIWKYGRYVRLHRTQLTAVYHSKLLFKPVASLLLIFRPTTHETTLTQHPLYCPYRRPIKNHLTFVVLVIVLGAYRS